MKQITSHSVVPLPDPLLPVPVGRHHREDLEAKDQQQQELQERRGPPVDVLKCKDCVISLFKKLFISSHSLIVDSEDDHGHDGGQRGGRGGVAAHEDERAAGGGGRSGLAELRGGDDGRRRGGARGGGLAQEKHQRQDAHCEAAAAAEAEDQGI